MCDAEYEALPAALAEYLHAEHLFSHVRFSRRGMKF